MFQNADTAIVKKLTHLVETGGNTTTVFAINLNDHNPILQDITHSLPFYRDAVYDSSTIDYRSSRLFADKNGTLVHTLKNSINEDINGFDLWYIDIEERKNLKQYGYRERKF